MRSPITLVTKINLERGFLMSEIVIAFALMTLLTTSAIILSSTMQSLHKEGVKQLENIQYATSNITSPTFYTKKPYGNDTYEISLDPITTLTSDYKNGWGRDTCDPRLKFDKEKVSLYSAGIDLGSGNHSTDIEVRNEIAYLTADSSIASQPDLYIIDINNPDSPKIISTLNTGPGLNALEVAGHYIYAANLSTTNQLQVIDIANRGAPTVVAKLKLPLPQASTTAPFAYSIFYNKGFIYLGTQKWDGNEFNIIDVSVPTSPRYLGGFETNTLVNNIYVRDSFAYLADSDLKQMRILDVHNPSNITEVASFSPSGSEVAEGKILSYFEGELSLGRTVGGFNVPTNQEFFTFSTTSLSREVKISHDIPGGVYGIISRPPFIYLATKSIDHEFQVWNQDMTSLVFEKPLGFYPYAMACDNQTLYFATGDRKGVAVLKIN